MLLNLTDVLAPSDWTNGLQQLDFGCNSFRFRDVSDVEFVKCERYYQLEHKYWCVNISNEDAKYLANLFGFNIVQQIKVNPELTQISGTGFSVYFDEENKPVATLLDKKRYGIDNLFFSLQIPPADAFQLSEKYGIYIKKSSTLV